MLLLLLKILVVCTALLAWIVLTVAGISLLRYIRYDKRYVLILPVLAVLWMASSFNSWYESFFLFNKRSLLSSLDSWIFTLLTPLFYFYLRFRISGRFPDSWQWIRHLFLPVILAGMYIGMAFSYSVSDRLIYSWDEWAGNTFTWWVDFRIGCCIVWILQIAVYLTRLLRISKKYQGQDIRCIKKELGYIGFFYLFSMLSIFTPFYVCNILFNLFLACMGIYIWKQSVFYRVIKHKTHRFLFSYFFNASPVVFLEKTDVPLLLTREEEERLNRLLKSPEFLHNPDLTIRMLARELGTNATTLSRYFNRQLEIGFTEYVTALRLDEAEVLLKETDRKVIEISESVGFQTSSTFYQAFKTRHHAPPLQWRKKFKVD